MSRDYQLSEFPLQRFDCHGDLLSAGELAKIVALPDINFHGFDELARKRYTALKDRVLPISEYDENGYAHFLLWYLSATDLLGTSAEPVGVDQFETHEFYFDARDLERA